MSSDSSFVCQVYGPQTHSATPPCRSSFNGTEGSQLPAAPALLILFLLVEIHCLIIGSVSAIHQATGTFVESPTTSSTTETVRRGRPGPGSPCAVPRGAFVGGGFDFLNEASEHGVAGSGFVVAAGGVGTNLGGAGLDVAEGGGAAVRPGAERGDEVGDGARAEVAERREGVYLHALACGVQGRGQEAGVDGRCHDRFQCARVWEAQG